PPEEPAPASHSQPRLLDRALWLTIMKIRGA
ncbi:MAG: hypothetical protein ACJAV4_001197, partial [Pontimonas sp.]